MNKLDELRRTMGVNVAESASRREGQALPAATLSALNPARMDGVARSKNALEIPIDKIDRDPTQPREEFDEDAIARLAESIRARGLLQPVRVRWDEERGKYVLIAGERRWRASRMAGLPTMTCVVVEGEIPPGELLAIQVTENLQREDLRPIERARAFQTLMALHGWSGNQLAKELGISQSSIVHALALLELPGPAQEKVERGVISPATAYEASKIEDPEAQREVLARVVDRGLTRGETAELVREVKRRQAPKPDGKGRGAAKSGPPRPKVFRTAGGKVTVEMRKDGSPQAVRAALLEAAEQVLPAREDDRDQPTA